MRKRKKLIGFLTVFLGLMLLVACGNEESDENSDENSDVKMATASSSGVFYTNGTALEQLSKEKSDTLTIFPQATGGSGDNLNLLKDGDVDIAMAHNSTAVPAYDGEEEFEDNQITEFMGITSVWKSQLHTLVRNDAGIDKIEDIKGKRFQVGPIGSGIEKFSLQPLSVHGISEEDIKGQRLDVSEAVDQIRNNQLDGMIHGSSLPDGNATDLMSTGDVKMLPMADDKVEDLTEKYSIYESSTIPAETYPNQEEDIDTAASSALLLVRPDMDEEVVYELTKLIHENNDYLTEQHTSFEDTTLENAVQGFGNIPIHPGAEKYYKEEGILD